MKICENCKKEHDGSYGTGRFCSKNVDTSILENTLREIMNIVLGVSVVNIQEKRLMGHGSVSIVI